MGKSEMKRQKQQQRDIKAKEKARRGNNKQNKMKIILTSWALRLGDSKPPNHSTPTNQILFPSFESELGDPGGHKVWVAWKNGVRFHRKAGAATVKTIKTYCM